MIIAQRRREVNHRGRRRKILTINKGRDFLDEPSVTSEPLILAIETATRAGGVSVTRGEKLLSSREGDASVSHSTNLIEMIDSVLKAAEAELADIDLFAVAVGPGSFTGLRIGLATVKAFAESTHRPIVGVSTLAAVAHASGYEGLVASLLPAGRGEVFAQLFCVSDGSVELKDPPAHLNPQEAFSKYKDNSGVHWTGEGTGKLQEYLEDVAADTSPRLANSVAALALKDYRQGKTVAPEELRAVYVRASDAEINERWQQQKQQSQAQA